MNTLLVDDLGQAEVVRAMYTYETTQESHLPLVQGEYVIVLEKDPSGWWIGCAPPAVVVVDLLLGVVAAVLFAVVVSLLLLFHVVVVVVVVAGCRLSPAGWGGHVLTSAVGFAACCGAPLCLCGIVVLCCCSMLCCCASLVVDVHRTVVRELIVTWMNRCVFARKVCVHV